MNLAAYLSYRLKRLGIDRSAQDLIEYALMAGFVATTAGAIMPSVATSISKIMSTVANILADSSRTPNG